jgi:hypothetical protein
MLDHTKSEDLDLSDFLTGEESEIDSSPELPLSLDSGEAGGGLEPAPDPGLGGVSPDLRDSKAGLGVGVDNPTTISDLSDITSVLREDDVREIAEVLEALEVLGGS